MKNSCFHAELRARVWTLFLLLFFLKVQPIKDHGESTSYYNHKIFSLFISLVERDQRGRICATLYTTIKQNGQYLLIGAKSIPYLSYATGEDNVTTLRRIMNFYQILNMFIFELTLKCGIVESSKLDVKVLISNLVLRTKLRISSRISTNLQHLPRSDIH